MKKFKSEELIDQLEQDIRQIIAAAEHLKTADPIKLNYTSKTGIIYPSLKNQWYISPKI